MVEMFGGLLRELREAFPRLNHEWRKKLLGALLPGHEAEWLLDAVMEMDQLLVDQLPKGCGRWRELDDDDLVEHLSGHIDEVAWDVRSRDRDTRHYSAAHVAVRGVMTLAYAMREQEENAE